MKVAHDAPRRPALRYYGGKWNLAPWIISHFPQHTNYVEPCGGAASVLLQKPRSLLETYNDINGNVVNFFRVLRDQPDELIRKIRLTPWSRKEYESHNQKTDDPVEWARQFWMLCWISVQGGSHASVFGSHWRSIRHADSRTGTPPPKDGIDIAHLEVIAERLKWVQIDCIDWQDAVAKYDNRDALFYFDPPYVPDTRGNSKRYAHEWDRQDHIEAADILHDVTGMVVISGYACDLYADLCETNGWHRVNKEAQTNSGGKRIESLWLSPRTWKTLQHDMSGLPLFETAS